MGNRSFKLTDFIALFLLLFLINFVIGLIFKIDIFIELFLLFSLNEIMLFMILEEMFETYSIKKEYKKINYENLDDFKYYRELLKMYSISELALIYNKNIESNFLIALEINYLMKKGNLKIDGNSLIVVKNQNLNYIQNYLLDSLKFIDLSELKKKFMSKIKEKLIKDNILIHLYDDNKYSGIIYLIVIVYVFAMIITMRVGGIVWIISNLVFFLELYIFFLTFDKYSIRIRTRKGQEIYLRLIGLKKYLNDFTNFDEKQLQDIYLWDEYILYAIMLEESKESKDEIMNFYIDISKKIANGDLEIVE